MLILSEIMGSFVSLDSQRPPSANLKDHGDWFINQGYKLNLDIRCNPDALADHEVYNNARFSCMLPTINPVTTQRNNDIYEHVTKMKLNSQSKNASKPGCTTSGASCSTRIP